MTVVLPSYNESGNIVQIVQALIAALSGFRFEIVIVDDSSPDGTAALVRRTFGGDARVRLIERTEDRGLATAIRDGMRQAKDWILVLDTDFNHSPEDAPVVLAALEGCDLVAGSRFVPGGSMPDQLRYSLSYVYNSAIRLLFLSPLTDHLSGYFAIRKPAFDELEAEKIFWGFGDYYLRLLLLARRHGLSIREVPLRYGHRRAGESKTSFNAIFLKYTKEVLKLFVMRALGKW